MKFSEMTTEQASDVVVKIMEPVTNILKDSEAAKIMTGAVNAKKVEEIFAVLLQVVPYCLEKHRTDTYRIVGALSGKTEKVIAKQKFLATMKDIMDSIDQELVDFFRSYARTGSGEEQSQD